MAIKDVYVPYEEWLEQVVSIEDFVIGKLFKQVFCNPTMLQYCENSYVLQYPFGMSYLAHCIDVYQKENEAGEAIVEFMKKNSKDANPLNCFNIEATDYIPDDLDDAGCSYAFYSGGEYQDRNSIFGDIISEFNEHIKPIDKHGRPSILIESNFDDELVLPIVGSNQFTFNAFMQSRIAPSITTMISADTYDIIKDWPCIINKDRNDVWAYDPTWDVSVQYMQNLATRIQFNMFGGYKIYVSINGETFDIGDTDTEEKAKSICDKVISQMNQNVSTIYPFEWSEY